jgi:sterol desaturase/sphingolipid hydroxylase (fatty acid hydroxylase superfamily)
MDTFSTAGWAFVILAAIFVPMESCFSMVHQGRWRQGLALDALFFLGQFLIFATPALFCLSWLHSVVEQAMSLGMRALLHEIPLGLRIGIAVIFSDLCTYWWHRACHASPLLWRFHRVHHSAHQLDWMAAYRAHPVDNIATRVIENIPLMLLSVPFDMMAGFAVFRGIWAVFIHSNVNLNIGPLEYLLGHPMLHHWHHACGASHAAVNFANLNPIMDLLFGTLDAPAHPPTALGMREAAPRSYLGQLLWPFRRSSGATASNSLTNFPVFTTPPDSIPAHKTTR